MKRIPLFITALSLLVTANAQKGEHSRYLSLAVFNTENAKPFEMLSGLFGETLHPGVEAGYGTNFSVGQHHQWFAELKIAYFYHRYVQHAIPVYLNFGYRYRVTDHFSAEASLGTGIMPSIPATAKLKLNDGGLYVKDKGVARMQATASFAFGVGYTLNPGSASPVRIITAWQQRIQTPFVKSYVPILPYNSFMIGVSRGLKSK